MTDEKKVAITVDSIRAKVAEIDECKFDYEIAHDMEDQLFIAVLTAISQGAANAAELATEALRSTKIDFPRYTA